MATGLHVRALRSVLSLTLHDHLHWLDVPDRVLFKLAVTVHLCLNGRAPPYLSEHCIPVSSADTRRHLRSANRHLLAVARFPLNTYGRRAFSVAGPMARKPGTHSRILSSAVVKVDRRIRWHYTTTILRLRIGARLTMYRNCKFHNGCRTISRHANGISRLVGGVA